MRTVSQTLESRPYPGRGCLAARSGNSRLSLVYILTGRSAASRNRKLIILDNGDVAVRDTAGTALRHDLLRHYVAAARRRDWLVIGNGDQVVPRDESLASGLPVAIVLRRLLADLGEACTPSRMLTTSSIFTVEALGGGHRSHDRRHCSAGCLRIRRRCGNWYRRTQSAP
jgi:IMP cyclohydrolase-like protein